MGKNCGIRKIRAQHQQRVAVHHGVVAGGKAQQPGHADVVGIVVLDELLAAQRMHDRRLQLRSHCHQLIMRALAARAAQDGDLLRPVEQLGGLAQFPRGGTNHRCGSWMPSASGGLGALALETRRPG